MELIIRRKSVQNIKIHSRNCVNCGYGFTILELLITLVIAVSITAISAVAYSRLSSTSALKATSQDLLVTLRHARNRAITEGKEKVVVVDSKKRIYGISGNKRLRTLDSTLSMQLFSARFRGSNQDIAQIRFAPDGSSSGGEIKITNGKKSYRIVVQWLTGKVELSHG